MTEKSLKQKVLRDLKAIPGIWFVKTQEVGRRGIPDILICARGKMIALELKTDIGKVDPLQQATLDKIHKAGGFAMVVRPSDWAHKLSTLQLNGWL